MGRSARQLLASIETTDKQRLAFGELLFVDKVQKATASGKLRSQYHRAVHLPDPHPGRFAVGIAVRDSGSGADATMMVARF